MDGKPARYEATLDGRLKHKAGRFKGTVLFLYFFCKAFIVIAKIKFRLITKVNQGSNNGCHDLKNGNYMMFWRLP